MFGIPTGSMEQMVASTQYAKYALDNWVEDLKERNPFWIRQSKEKMKTSKNNNNIWKVLMLSREVIKARIKELSDPRNTLFYCETLV